jgi:polyisoprenyl-teichoic acid--peptidoglycan teichoic acid transferase
MSRSVLANPAALISFASTAGSYVSVDQQFDLPTMLALAASMRLSGSSSIHSFTLPTDGTGTSSDGQSIVNVDPAGTAAVGAALANDTVGQLPYAQSGG